MDKVTEQDARPARADEEAWSVVLRYADTRLLKAAVVVGVAGIWALVVVGWLVTRYLAQIQLLLGK